MKMKFQFQAVLQNLFQLLSVLDRQLDKGSWKQTKETCFSIILQNRPIRTIHKIEIITSHASLPIVCKKGVVDAGRQVL